MGKLTTVCLLPVVLAPRAQPAPLGLMPVGGSLEQKPGGAQGLGAVRVSGSHSCRPMGHATDTRREARVQLVSSFRAASCLLRADQPSSSKCAGSSCLPRAVGGWGAR